MKDKNGQEITDGSRIRFQNGTEAEYRYISMAHGYQRVIVWTLPNSRQTAELFVSNDQAAAILSGCEVVGPVTIEALVFTKGYEPSGAWIHLAESGDGGFKYGDRVKVTVEKL